MSLSETRDLAEAAFREKVTATLKTHPALTEVFEARGARIKSIKILKEL